MKPPEPAKVETIAHKDHTILIPPSTLRDRAMSMVAGDKDAFDFSALERAQEALAELEADFTGWMKEEAERLEAARNTARATPNDPSVRDALYRVAHDIRGHAETFGYPLAGRMADSMCDLMDGTDDISGAVYELIDAHVDAIRAVVRDNVHGSGDDIARSVVHELIAAREALLGVSRLEKIDVSALP
jgi:chemotaxis protein histidine kinase CheA